MTAVRCGGAETGTRSGWWSGEVVCVGGPGLSGRSLRWILYDLLQMQDGLYRIRYGPAAGVVADELTGGG